MQLTKDGSNRYLESWNKHVMDVNDLVFEEYVSIKELDPPIVEKENITLRKYMMDLKHENGSYLFHHINVITNDMLGLKMRVAIFPENKIEAMDKISLITTHAIRDVGQEAEVWFSKEAIEQHREVEIDSKGDMHTLDNKMLNCVIECTGRLNIDYVLKSINDEDEGYTGVNKRGDARSYYSYGSGVPNIGNKLSVSEKFELTERSMVKIKERDNKIAEQNKKLENQNLLMEQRNIEIKNLLERLEKMEKIINKSG